MSLGQHELRAGHLCGDRQMGGVLERREKAGSMRSVEGVA